jgi:WD40 repeat protein
MGAAGCRREIASSPHSWQRNSARRQKLLDIPRAGVRIAAAFQEGPGFASGETVGPGTITGAVCVRFTGCKSVRLVFGNRRCCIENCGTLARRTRNSIQILCVLISAFCLGTRAHGSEGTVNSVDVKWISVGKSATSQWVRCEWGPFGSETVAVIGPEELAVWDLRNRSPIIARQHGIRNSSNQWQRVRMRFSPDASEIAVHSTDGHNLIRRLRVSDGQELKSLSYSGLTLSDFVFENNNEILLLGNDGRIKRVNLLSGHEQSYTIQPPPSYFRFAELSRRGLPVLAIKRQSKSSTALLFNETRNLPDNQVTLDGIKSLSRFTVGRRADQFAAAVTDHSHRPFVGAVYFRDPLNEKRISVGCRTTSTVTAIALEASGCFAVCAERNGRVTVWDTIANGGVSMTSHEAAHIIDAQVSHDSRFLAVVMASGEAKVCCLDQFFSVPNDMDSADSLIRDLGSDVPSVAGGALLAATRNGRRVIPALCSYAAALSEDYEGKTALVRQFDSSLYATRRSAFMSLRDASVSITDDEAAVGSAESRSLKRELKDTVAKAPLSPRVKRCIAALRGIGNADAIAILRGLKAHPATAISCEAEIALKTIE